MLPMAPFSELKDDSPKAPPIDAPCTPESATTRTTLPTPPSSYLGYHDDPDDPEENDGNDSDSAYGDSLATDDTKTLSTYITAYPYEFGRRYHAFHDGAYWVRRGFSPIDPLGANMLARVRMTILQTSNRS